MTEVRTKIRRGAELSYEGASRAGFRLGYFAMIGSPGFESRLFQKLLEVSRAEARRRAAETFRRERRVVVRYEPTGGDDGLGA
jgi:hypothetical protein